MITNGTRKPFIAKGNQLKGSSRLKVTQLLQLNSPQTRFGIQPLDDHDGLVVYSVKITYFFCPEKTFNGLAHFPRSHSPRNGSLPVKVKGVCLRKFSNTKPVANCGSNGNWSYNETFSCDCGPGYITTATGCNGK